MRSRTVASPRARLKRRRDAFLAALSSSSSSGGGRQQNMPTDEAFKSIYHKWQRCWLPAPNGKWMCWNRHRCTTFPCIFKTSDSIRNGGICWEAINLWREVKLQLYISLSQGCQILFGTEFGKLAHESLGYKVA